MGDAMPAFFFRHVVEGPHVVQTVRQLNEQNPNILTHGQQQLAKILGLLCTVRLQFQLGKLGDAPDQERDLTAELLSDLFARGLGILNRVVQQRSDDRRGIEMIMGQDLRHFERMTEIGVPRRPLLRTVSLHRELIGTAQRLHIRVGIVGSDLLGKFVRFHHEHIIAMKLCARKSPGASCCARAIIRGR